MSETKVFPVSLFAWSSIPLLIFCFIKKFAWKLLFVQPIFLLHVTNLIQIKASNSFATPPPKQDDSLLETIALILREEGHTEEEIEEFESFLFEHKIRSMKKLEAKIYMASSSTIFTKSTSIKDMVDSLFLSHRLHLKIENHATHPFHSAAISAAAVKSTPSLLRPNITTFTPPTIPSFPSEPFHSSYSEDFFDVPTINFDDDDMLSSEPTPSNTTTTTTTVTQNESLSTTIISEYVKIVTQESSSPTSHQKTEKKKRTKISMHSNEEKSSKKTKNTNSTPQKKTVQDEKEDESTEDDFVQDDYDFEEEDTTIPIHADDEHFISRIVNSNHLPQNRKLNILCTLVYLSHLLPIPIFLSRCGKSYHDATIAKIVSVSVTSRIVKPTNTLRIHVEFPCQSKQYWFSIEDGFKEAWKTYKPNEKIPNDISFKFLNQVGRELYRERGTDFIVAKNSFLEIHHLFSSKVYSGSKPFQWKLLVTEEEDSKIWKQLEQFEKKMNRLRQVNTSSTSLIEFVQNNMGKKNVVIESNQLQKASIPVVVQQLPTISEKQEQKIITESIVPQTLSMFASTVSTNTFLNQIEGEELDLNFYSSADDSDDLL